MRLRATYDVTERKSQCHAKLPRTTVEAGTRDAGRRSRRETLLISIESRSRSTVGD
ncbi:hypothetical protein LINGRAHAP2_LOCUS2598 [Linum grandiflorum]